MGTAKQLLQIGDRTLLQTTLDMIGQSAVAETILVLGHEAERVQRSVESAPPTKVVINRDYAEGMSTSIKAGIAAISAGSSAAMIVLADQPLLKSSVIDQMIGEYEKSHSAIIVPMYKGFRGNPVLIDRSLFPEMMQISGDIGCRSLFGLHPEAIQKIAVEDIGILVDIDTAEDLKKLSRPGLDNVDLRDRSVTSERAIAIIGNDELVVALTRLAKVLKFQVFVFDPLLTPDDLPQADRIINDLDLAKAGVAEKSAIVIASRGKFDEEALEQAVRLGAGYIALMGSKKRGAELIASLRAKGIPEEALTRIHSPAGLAIGAETPEEIALSIMAEIVLTTKSQRHKETTK